MIGNPPNNNQVTNNLVTQAEKPLTAREKNKALHGEWGSARTGISLVALSGVLARCDHQHAPPMLAPPAENEWSHLHIRTGKLATATDWHFIALLLVS